MARTEGRRYCNHHVLTYQAERMPEPLRHKVRKLDQIRTIGEYFLRWVA